ncbi:MAG: hypothetical protein HZA17_05760 [Nitrospirae bacterium]|nr:hypothetical protein [Nitrospirota bacterium]
MSWQSFQRNRELIEAGQMARVEMYSEIVSNGLKTTMPEGRAGDLQKFLETLIHEDIEAIRIISASGRIINSSIPGEVGQSVRKDITPPPARSNLSIFRGYDEGKKIYSQVILIRNDMLCRRCHSGEETLRGILDVEISTRELDLKVHEEGRRIMRDAFFLVILLVLSVGLVSFYLVRRPLVQIADIAGSMLEGKRRSGLSRGRSDELGTLAAGVKALMSDLRKSKEEVDKCRMDKDKHLERMASLGELAALVAHEIKNPLAGISGALQVLAEDFPDDSPRKEIAFEILHEIGRLDMAVKDLLFFARPPELNLIQADINAIIDKMRALLIPEALASNVQIDFRSDTAREVMVDPDQMEKALFYIARYFIQSIQGGGKLTWMTGYNADSGEVEISLSDTSSVMDEEKLKSLFKPLFSTKRSGTGLGLAISRNIVENHKGRIELVSRAGEGTTFRIMLPKKG